MEKKYAIVKEVMAGLDKFSRYVHKWLGAMLKVKNEQKSLTYEPSGKKKYGIY